MFDAMKRMYLKRQSEASAKPVRVGFDRRYRTPVSAVKRISSDRSQSHQRRALCYVRSGRSRSAIPQSEDEPRITLKIVVGIRAGAKRVSK
jgi:hypothetical protein